MIVFYFKMTLGYFIALSGIVLSSLILFHYLGTFDNKEHNNLFTDVIIILWDIRNLWKQNTNIIIPFLQQLKG